MHPATFHPLGEKGVRKESERIPKDGQNRQIASTAAVNWDFSV